ncbi:MAG: lysophospholipid acyltransferase family protein [Melioribacteraceae bacterium]|nr:lysophospholipid acyltransferase family protein [Melioribacteraceae bacterium]
MVLINKNKLEFSIWKFFTKVVHVIGINRIPILAKILTMIFFYLIPIRKKIVISNLAKAFPEKSKSEIKQIAFNNFLSIGITFMEIMAFQQMDEEEILSLSEINNFEVVKNVVDSDKGSILLTAHVGNWELGALTMGLSLNKQINVLVKKQRNRLVTNWMNEVREKFTNKEVPLGASVRELYKTLINGGIVGIVGDQRGKKEDGVTINFFNRPTVTFQGFAALGIKNKVPIVVVLNRRLPSGKYLFDVEEIKYDNLPEKLSDQLLELNQRYMTILENHIRKAPEQWLWMHNIWKY